MFNTKVRSLGLLGFAIAAGTCLGQTADVTKFYKMEFVVKEVEGTKVVNSRSYFMTVPVEAPGQNVQGSGSIRASSRVPTVAGGGSNFTYVDVGVNLDCKTLHEMQSAVSVYLSADISTNSVEPNLPAPVIRQNRWSSTVVVPIKKPTVVYASDDATSKRQMQLELTATPIP
jgi:hypothetical protein